MEYKDGRLVRMTTEGYLSYRGPAKEEFMYNKDGQQIASKHYREIEDTTPSGMVRFTIERDEKGNCIRRTSRYITGQSLLEEREIVYAGDPLPEEVVRLQAVLDRDRESAIELEPETPVPVVAKGVLRTPIVDESGEESSGPSRMLDPEKETQDLTASLWSLNGSAKRLVQNHERILSSMKISSVKIRERNPVDGKLYLVSAEDKHYFDENESPTYESKTVWIRDADNRLVEKRTTDKDGTTTRREQLNYNESGKLVEVLVGGEKPPASDRQYSYDDAGRLIEEIIFSDTKPRWTWQYGYDFEGRLIRRTQRNHALEETTISEYVYSSDGKAFTGTEKTFDEDGRLMNQSKRISSAELLRDETETENAEGQLLSHTIVELMNGMITFTTKKPIGGDLFFVDIFQYTLNPDAYLRTKMIDDHVLTQEDVRYDFDAHGNWTEQRIYKDGQLSERTVREIEYEDEFGRAVTP